MLSLVSVTLLGASVSAEPTSNVVTPEGSERSDPSVGHEFMATYAENFVHDPQPTCADRCSSRSRYSRCGLGDAPALPVYHTSPPFFMASQLPSLSLTHAHSSTLGFCIGSSPKRFLQIRRCFENLSSGEKRAGCADSVGLPVGVSFCAAAKGRRQP